MASPAEGPPTAAFLYSCVCMFEPYSFPAVPVRSIPGAIQEHTEYGIVIS